MQKRVLEVLKTWYFPYSAFWSAGQWGGYSPPPLATLLVPSMKTIVTSSFMLRVHKEFYPQGMKEWKTGNEGRKILHYFVRSPIFLKFQAAVFSPH